MKQKTKMMTQDGKKQDTNGYIISSQCDQLPVGLIRTTNLIKIIVTMFFKICIPWRSG